MNNKYKDIIFKSYPKIKGYIINITLTAAKVISENTGRPISDTYTALFTLYKTVKEDYVGPAVHDVLFTLYKIDYSVKFNLYRAGVTTYNVVFNLYGEKIYEPIPRDLNIYLYKTQPSTYFVNFTLVEASTEEDHSAAEYDPYLYLQCITN